MKKSKSPYQLVKQTWLVPPGKTSFTAQAYTASFALLGTPRNPNPSQLASWRQASVEWIETPMAVEQAHVPTVAQWLREVLQHALLHELHDAATLARLPIEIRIDAKTARVLVELAKRSGLKLKRPTRQPRRKS